MTILSKLGVTLLVVACSGTARSAEPKETITPLDPPSSATPGPARTGQAPAPDSPVAADSPSKTQPAHIKLKLGHFKNAKRGIGVTIDRTATIDNVAKIPPAKIKFDGETKVWLLNGARGSRDRLDFTREGGGVMLEVWDDGRHAVYVPDPDTGKWSDEIDVTRDGDADPL